MIVRSVVILAIIIPLIYGNNFFEDLSESIKIVSNLASSSDCQINIESLLNDKTELSFVEKKILSFRISNCHFSKWRQQWHIVCPEPTSNNIDNCLRQLSERGYETYILYYTHIERIYLGIRHKNNLANTIDTFKESQKIYDGILDKQSEQQENIEQIGSQIEGLADRWMTIFYNLTELINAALDWREKVNNILDRVSIHKGVSNVSVLVNKISTIVSWLFYIALIRILSNTLGIVISKTLLESLVSTNTKVGIGFLFLELAIVSSTDTLFEPHYYVLYSLAFFISIALVVVSFFLGYFSILYKEKQKKTLLDNFENTLTGLKKTSQNRIPHNFFVQRKKNHFDLNKKVKEIYMY